MTIARPVRILARRAWPDSGQSTRRCSRPSAERVSCPRLDDLDAVLLCFGQRDALVRARSRQVRIEHAIDGNPAQHGLGTADVVALRMREDDRSQPPHAERAELLCDVRLGRALVDEHRALRHLQENRVALADVEERDAEPVRRRQRRRRKQLPDEEDGNDGRSARQRRRPPPPRQPLEREQGER